MSDFRVRPMSDYLQSASWEQLYALTEHWQSDLQFYKDEIHFLRDLFSKYFMLMVEESTIQSVKNAVEEITELENRRSKLTNSVNDHLRHLDELMENEFSHDAQSFRDEHATLEDEFASFLKDFRYVKEEFFNMTKGAIANRKRKVS